MGPERKAPENKRLRRKPTKDEMLQWGRSKRLRKTTKGLAGKRSSPGFNGAGAKGSGKRPRIRSNPCCTAPLQWGRSERLRKTWYWVCVSAGTLGFNGAGAKGSGKHADASELVPEIF